MLAELIGDGHFLTNVECSDWEQLVDITGEPLVRKKLVEPEYLQSVKDTVKQYGSYMVLIDDVAFLHGRPEAGVHKVCMTLVLLKNPITLIDKSVKAAFMFGAIDNDSHINILQELAELLNDDEFSDLLIDGKNPEAILLKLKGGV